LRSPTVSYSVSPSLNLQAATAMANKATNSRVPQALDKEEEVGSQFVCHFESTEQN